MSGWRIRRRLQGLGRRESLAVLSRLLRLRLQGEGRGGGLDIELISNRLEGVTISQSTDSLAVAFFFFFSCSLRFFRSFPVSLSVGHTRAPPPPTKQKRLCPCLALSLSLRASPSSPLPVFIRTRIPYTLSLLSVYMQVYMFPFCMSGLVETELLVQVDGDGKADGSRCSSWQSSSGIPHHQGKNRWVKTSINLPGRTVYPSRYLDSYLCVSPSLRTCKYSACLPASDLFLSFDRVSSYFSSPRSLSPCPPLRALRAASAFPTSRGTHAPGALCASLSSSLSLSLRRGGCLESPCGESGVPSALSCACSG